MQRCENFKAAGAWALAFLVVVVGVALVSCSRADASALRVSFVSSTGAERGHFTLEVAATEAQRSRGLMFRRSLERDRGMLFVFPEQREHTFWMKNTVIPLDMVFVGEGGRVVGILHDVAPLTETGRSIGKESIYVLEFLGGTMRALGVSEGDTVRFDGPVPAAQ